MCSRYPVANTYPTLDLNTAPSVPKPCRGNTAEKPVKGG